MRGLVFAIACLTVWAAGCESKPTDSGQDKEKAQPRKMVTPGDVPGHLPPPPKR
jgi:hypothetical protein